MKQNHVLYITRTALFLALLIMVQWVTKPLGQLVTGSAVNFILIASTLLCGLTSGMIVAIVSPFLAFFFGIGPAFIQLVPFIALGNLVLVLVFGLVLKKNNTLPYWLIAAVAGTLLKFAALYLGIVQLVLPLIPGIKAAQITAISTMFSWPQLVTAAIGSILSLLLIPPIKKALHI